MRAKAIRNKFEGCPALIASWGSPETDTHITVGKEYEVHAMSVFEGVVSLQIVCDVKIPDWSPAWFFEICDPSVPDDWICNVFDGALQMVLGPKFIAASVDSHARMVQLEPEPVAEFWRRISAREEAEQNR